jgi:hypothetical protein
LREFSKRGGKTVGKHVVRFSTVFPRRGSFHSFHGYPRYTGDIDILLRCTEENATRVVDVLKAFGFPGAQEFKSTLTEPERVVQLGRAPNRIDLLTSVSGLQF